MRKRILLLQGPVGGYFRFLQRALEDAGFDVRRLVFNSGDILFSLGRPFEIVRPKTESYEQRIEAIIRDWPADAVLLFGDERPIHRAAKEAAAHIGVPVFCFEEGYLRPDFVTFEIAGNNANSLLAKTFDLAREAGRATKVPPLRNSTYAMTRAAMIYFGALRLSHPFFPRYRHHRERRIRSEFRYWARSLWRRTVARRHDERFIALLESENHPQFFMVALQVHDDMQLLRHGRGWTIRAFLETVLASFREHAPEDCTLVVKAHPLDVGYGHHKKNLRYMMEESGLGGRIVFLQSGPFMPIVRHARGLVTINSTAGIAALECGIPVLTFGDALYQADGLAQRLENRDVLDRFWVEPPPVDHEKAHRFRSHVREHALVPGSFYLRETWPSMSDEVIGRLRSVLGE